ncbi:hypothetical protein ACSTHL_23695, partial [Vibrio parahaemolyticus]
PTRVGFKFEADGKKVRFAKRSGELIPEAKYLAMAENEKAKPAKGAAGGGAKGGPAGQVKKAKKVAKPVNDGKPRDFTRPKDYTPRMKAHYQKV